MHYKNSPLATPSGAFLQSHPSPVIAIHDDLARSAHAHTEPPLPNWTELLAEFEAAYRDIWGGEVDVRARLVECQARIKFLTDLARRRLSRSGVRYP